MEPSIELFRTNPKVYEFVEEVTGNWFSFKETGEGSVDFT